MSDGDSPLTSTLSLELPQRDDYAAADPARRRLASKRRFPLFASLAAGRAKPRRLGSTEVSLQERQQQQGETHASQPASPRSETAGYIELSHSEYPGLPEDEKNEYRWAALFENQRGVTLFSTALYSSSSLLPVDPQPYTAPGAPPARNHQPALTPGTYPLPDGNWRWVSTRWMIDMRHEGEVQWDGFEYNWRFRARGWRPHAGPVSGGAWVRRRMWVRLMMKPHGKTHVPKRIRHEGGEEGADNGVSSHSGHDGPVGNGRAPSSWPGTEWSLQSAASSSSRLHPPSVVESAWGATDAMLEADAVWKGDDAARDWERCRALLRRLGRDGRRLELWRRWLGDYRDGARLEQKDEGEEKRKGGNEKWKGKGRQPAQWSSDDEPLPSEVAKIQRAEQMPKAEPPPLDYIRPVLRAHGRTLLHLFVYPESRVEFLELVLLAGLLPEMDAGVLVEVDFWSYMQELDAFGGQIGDGFGST